MGGPRVTFAPTVIGVMAFLGLAAFAGCVGGGGDAAGRPNEPVFDSDTGAIRGQILSEEEIPIPGATAGIEAVGALATSDADGNFVLNKVPPGDHEVQSIALGFEPAAQRVTVKAGTATDLVVFHLVALPADVPYHRTILSRVELTGVMWKVTPTCIYTDVNPLVKTCGGIRQACPPEKEDPCEQHTMEDPFKGFNDQWQTLVSEVRWTSQSGATGKGFFHDVNAPNVTRGSGGSINQADPYTFKKSSNKSPIQIRVDKDGLEAKKIKEKDWNNPPHKENCLANLDSDPELEERNNCDWFFRLFPAAYDAGIGEDGFGPDYGISYQNHAEIYFTFFIKAKADPGFTALPPT